MREAPYFADIFWRGGVRKTIEVQAPDIKEARRVVKNLVLGCDPEREPELANAVAWGNVRRKGARTSCRAQ